MKVNKSTFKSLCKMNQRNLKGYMRNALKKYYKTVKSGDGYLLASGADVLLTAHMDTVHKQLPKRIRDIGGVLSSPQGIGGDDRCGIYMILKILEAGYRPTILLCEDEEIGCVGAEKFVKKDIKLGDIKFMVELDRHGATDAVFYDCDNPEFTDFVEQKTGNREEWGSCSDISVLAPHYGVAAVNLSCGYYKEHTTDEYVVFTEMEAAVEKAISLIEAAKQLGEPFEYIEAKYYNWPSKSWKDLYYGDAYGEGLYPEETFLMVEYEADNILQSDWCEGIDDRDAILNFLMDHPEVAYGDIRHVEVA